MDIVADLVTKALLVVKVAELQKPYRLGGLGVDALHLEKNILPDCPASSRGRSDRLYQCGLLIP